jgi:hypothetical protein
MTMHETWTDQLSEYLDGELPDQEREAVEAHLRECVECHGVLNDLKRVVAQAQRIEARPPQDDLWSGIAARIDEGAQAAVLQGPRVARFVPRATRRIALTLPQLAAAAALLMAVSGGAAWKIAGRSEASRYTAEASRDTADVVASSNTDSPGSAEQSRVVTIGLADAQYDAAVADLEKALKDGRGRLDASTVAIVEHNLQIIDQAIDQARQALGTDPANSYLNGHLVEARRRKLDLLRRATALTETN